MNKINIKKILFIMVWISFFICNTGFCQNKTIINLNEYEIIDRNYIEKLFGSPDSVRCIPLPMGKYTPENYFIEYLDYPFGVIGFFSIDCKPTGPLLYLSVSDTTIIVNPKGIYSGMKAIQVKAIFKDKTWDLGYDSIRNYTVNLDINQSADYCLVIKNGKVDNIAVSFEIPEHYF